MKQKINPEKFIDYLLKNNKKNTKIDEKNNEKLSIIQNLDQKEEVTEEVVLEESVMNDCLKEIVDTFIKFFDFEFKRNEIIEALNQFSMNLVKTYEYLSGKLQNGISL